MILCILLYVHIFGFIFIYLSVAHIEQTYKIPELNDEYYNIITLNNKSYSLNDKTTVQLIKKIINYYNQHY